MSPDVTDLLNGTATSAYLGVPEGTLRQWRYLGIGPPYVRLGRHIRYRRDDLDAYISAQRVDPERDAT
jgi:excisionase family DNA binding protein